jgi:hypothetical protein
MSVKTLLPLTLIVFALAACQPLPAVPSAIALPEPAAIAPAATSEPASGDALTLTVEAAEVVVGVGSPIPVDITISGTLPDTCAQIGSIDQMVEGFDFSIVVNTFTPGLNDCIIDPIPFRTTIPLNTINLPDGEYTITVNDRVRTTFTMPIQQAAAPAEPRQIPVSNVTVDVGIGSPIPVDAFVSGEWPDLCAQLAEIRQEIVGNAFEIALLATAADPDCPPDYLGLPFRIAIPINVVELPSGSYTVSVNGVNTEFTVPVTPPASAMLDEPAHYQGPNPYRETPAFDVAYYPAIWEYVADDGSGRPSQLLHRDLPGCSIWLRAGPVDATPVASVWLAEREWTLAQVQPNMIQYTSPQGDIGWIFGVLLSETYSGQGNSNCQDAAEQVINTFQIIE